MKRALKTNDNNQDDNHIESNEEVGIFDDYFNALKDKNADKRQQFLMANPINGYIDTIHHTLLHYAIISGYSTEIIELLLRNGANPNQADKIGNTALHIAVYEQDENIAKLLLNNGADTALKDLKGNTPLHIAAEESNARLAQLLIESEANVNSQNTEGNTPLHVAIQSTIVKRKNDPEYDLLYLENFIWIMLSSRKVDLTITNLKGITVSSTALRLNDGNINLLLLLTIAAQNIPGLNSFILQKHRNKGASFSINFIINKEPDLYAGEANNLIQDSLKFSSILKDVILLKRTLPIEWKDRGRHPILNEEVSAFEHHCFKQEPKIENKATFWNNVTRIYDLYAFLEKGKPIHIISNGQFYPVTTNIVAYIYLCTGSGIGFDQSWLPIELQNLLVEHFLQLPSGVLANRNAKQQSSPSMEQ